MPYKISGQLWSGPVPSSRKFRNAWVIDDSDPENVVVVVDPTLAAEIIHADIDTHAGKLMMENPAHPSRIKAEELKLTVTAENLEDNWEDVDLWI